LLAKQPRLDAGGMESDRPSQLEKRKAPRHHIIDSAAADAKPSRYVRYLPQGLHVVGGQLITRGRVGRFQLITHACRLLHEAEVQPSGVNCLS
jgi:hypothetical protein